MVQMVLFLLPRRQALPRRLRPQQAIRQGPLQQQQALQRRPPQQELLRQQRAALRAVIPILVHSYEYVRFKFFLENSN